MVDNGCPNSLSVLTELDDSTLKKEVEKNPKALTIGSSLESSLTSSESSGRRENDDHVVLSLMEMNPPAKNGRKRSGSTISDGNCEGKRLQKDSKRFDLNSQYVNDFDFDFESRSNTLDLNSN
ncbi:hypothetical protein Ccrd_000152 [Cynara cardunculus var. scolymus]|uniref:Uncharacterized protein n=2 Tax=Cynara cardunculus var. scolymus TaxID=59895 RepID=A0A103XVR4_CYNCS|nr:hypothetical protein Ccrd_000152 [Cynara cardunculus var. scolymus]